MAAYAALVSLMNDLELIQNHPRHSFSFDNNQITYLSQIVDSLIDFMESYDSHGCSREAAEALEGRIASAAHAAHDVIESNVVDQIHAGSTLGGKSTSYFLDDLQKVIEEIDFIKKMAMEAKEESGLKAEQPTYSPPASAQPVASGKNIMVGFDAVLIRLMDMLTGEPSSPRVIPIVGMGGLGKTTLAKYAYEHLYIEQHFDVRVWATISQEYSVETILSELLFGERKSATTGNVNALGEKLHKKLWGRRYLIVLDDMWSLNAWDEIQMFFPENGNGSRIIVTTRLSNLAPHLSSSPPFEINFLDKDQSWQLFCGKAFGEAECPPELEGIGKKIVKKCQGLPLSIVVMGGHLGKSSRAIEYWEKVASFINPISSSGEDDNEQCLKIISLSYHSLPVCLKPCFLYMGTILEDEWIYASELIKLWVGEGFLKPKEGLSLEEVAEDYLKDLVDRNLVLVRERRWNGKPKYCGIHDSVRELCLSVGKKEKFLCVLDNIEGVSRERRIRIPEGKHHSDIVNALESAPLVRSLKSYRTSDYEFSFDKLSLELRLLRVSDYVEINGLKKEDGGCSLAADFQQVNLRYLSSYCRINANAGVNEIRNLPWSISLFWNLQTINMANYYIKISAPQEIWEMAQLRHLDFYELHLPVPQQECIVLRNLYTLVRVHNFRLTEEVCERMPNIKELTVSYYPSPDDSIDYCPHNLGRFNKLESLTFFGSDISRSFRFPTSLQELCLEDPHIHWEDLEILISSLPHLGYLHLDSVKGQEWSLAEEEFPSLKSLMIYFCDELIYWNANSSHFPVLEILDIFRAPKLSEIPYEIGDIPTLAHIKLNYCSVSASISAMRIVVEQESLANQDLQLHVNFTEMEQVERFQKILQEEGLTSNSLRLSHLQEKIMAF